MPWSHLTAPVVVAPFTNDATRRALSPLADWLLSATIPEAPISALVLSVALYSFLGWLWESTLCSLVNGGRFVNSGFLAGPCCPIYGVGGVGCWLLFHQVSDPLLLFAMSGAACCALEYAVGIAMERATGARFWDYSGLPLNVHGRVCLYGFVAFGLGVTAVCLVAEPWLLSVMAMIPSPLLALMASLFFLAVMVDLVGAMASWRRLSAGLEEMRTRVSMGLDKVMGNASDAMMGALPESAATAMETARERLAPLIGDGSAAMESTSRSATVIAAVPSTPSTRGANDVKAGHEGMAGHGNGRRVTIPQRLSQLPASVRIAIDRIASGFDADELRFFAAFPSIRVKRYDGVIKAANLRGRARRAFGGWDAEEEDHGDGQGDSDGTEPHGDSGERPSVHGR